MTFFHDSEHLEPMTSEVTLGLKSEKVLRLLKFKKISRNLDLYITIIRHMTLDLQGHINSNLDLI